jgi:DNA-binding Lrp family transcriptional regulator
MSNQRVLDATDLNILALLYAQPTLNNKALAEQVGLAASSCHERVKRLHAEQIIQGAYLQVDPESVGSHIQAMVAARLTSHSRETFASFQEDLLDTNEVVAIYHTGGENDFLIHVHVPNALHLRDFVFDKITARPEVNHVETALVYDFKVSKRLPKYR